MTPEERAQDIIDQRATGYHPDPNFDNLKHLIAESIAAAMREQRQYWIDHLATGIDYLSAIKPMTTSINGHITGYRVLLSDMQRYMEDHTH